jgi:hypothetical protein
LGSAGPISRFHNILGRESQKYLISFKSKRMLYHQSQNKIFFCVCMYVCVEDDNWDCWKGPMKEKVPGGHKSYHVSMRRDYLLQWVEKFVHK